jgi:energy-coupling factor transporter transmembrane protein EcfT
MNVRRDAPAPLLIGAMVGALCAGRIETALACVAAAALAAAWAGAPWPARRFGVTLAIGMGLALALNLYLNPGAALEGWPRVLGRPATFEGARYGVLLALRLLGAALAVHGLRATWPGERAADELARALGPLRRLRVPVDEARVVLGLGLRSAPLLEREARRIALLQRLRAGRAPRGPVERIDHLRVAAVPTLVRSLERAEQVALALEARHYRLRPVPAGRTPEAGWVVAGVGLAGVALLWRA